MVLMGTYWISVLSERVVDCHKLASPVNNLHLVYCQNGWHCWFCPIPVAAQLGTIRQICGSNAEAATIGLVGPTVLRKKAIMHDLLPLQPCNRWPVASCSLAYLAAELTWPTHVQTAIIQHLLWVMPKESGSTVQLGHMRSTVQLKLKKCICVFVCVCVSE